MGIQFGCGEGSNPATLTVDWSTATEIKEADETSTQKRQGMVLCLTLNNTPLF